MRPQDCDYNLGRVASVRTQGLSAYSQIDREGLHDMDHHIALFSFRLTAAQSIGPNSLRRLWSSACESDNVKVSRVSHGKGGSAHTYSLCASPRIANLAAIEMRLRRLLEETLPSAVNTLVCL